MFNNYNYFPFQGLQPRFSLLGGLRGLNFGEILSGTQKTLNVVNQAIPIFYQIRPLWNNTKTIFRIANAINDDGKKDNNLQTVQQTNESKENNTKVEKNEKNQTNGPVFFL